MFHMIEARCPGTSNIFYYNGNMGVLDWGRSYNGKEVAVFTDEQRAIETLEDIKKVINLDNIRVISYSG